MQTDGLPAETITKIYYDDEYIDNEKRAFQSLACAQGQYIPRLYGEVTVSGRRALAIEYVHGETLEKRISSSGESGKDWLYSLDEEIRELFNTPS
ncbi:hypothetical protein LTR33_009949, partial [Friedmanniomyces endolithicus]